METLYDVLLVLHLIGWAIVLGGALTSLRAPRIAPGMLHGILTALVTGIAMVGLASAGLAADEPDNVKIGVKLVIAVVVTALVLVGNNLPGALLVLGAVLVWAAVEGTALAWAVGALAVVATVVAAVGKYLVAGRHLKSGGVPNRTLLWGGLAGIVGFFVVPVVGLPLGFVLAVYLAELGRLHDRRRAWRATVVALQATGLTILIELAGALVAGGAWLLAAVLT
jgi:hypothetical protein